MMPWRDMADAPRDGTEFVGRCGDFAPFSCRWHEGGFVHIDPVDGFIGYVPTEWRLLDEGSGQGVKVMQAALQRCADAIEGFEQNQRATEDEQFLAGTKPWEDLEEACRLARDVVRHAWTERRVSSEADLEGIARAIHGSRLLQPVTGPWDERKSNVTQQHCIDAARAAVAAMIAA